MGGKCEHIHVWKERGGGAAAYRPIQRSLRLLWADKLVRASLIHQSRLHYLMYILYEIVSRSRIRSLHVAHNRLGAQYLHLT